jgi:hypothetical protein
MSDDTFTVPACVTCAHAHWPPRPLCPHCGATEFTPRAAEHGIVEEATETAGIPFASIRTNVGPIVVARLSSAAGAGTTVELDWSITPDGRRHVLATPNLSDRA